MENQQLNLMKLVRYSLTKEVLSIGVTRN